MGSWCGSVRQSYKMIQEGRKPILKLTEEKIQELNGLGFEFELTEHSKSFKERIGELRDYKVKYGDCQVPTRFESNPSLGKWCANVRQSYKMIQKGRKPILKLTEEKIQELKGLGFEFTMNKRKKTEAEIDTNSMIQVQEVKVRVCYKDDGRVLKTEIGDSESIEKPEKIPCQDNIAPQDPPGDYLGLAKSFIDEKDDNIELLDDELLDDIEYSNITAFEAV